MKMVETIGNAMRSNLVTSRACSMMTSRSFLEVRRFMTGG